MKSPGTKSAATTATGWLFSVWLMHFQRAPCSTSARPRNTTTCMATTIRTMAVIPLVRSLNREFRALTLSGRGRAGPMFGVNREPHGHQCFQVLNGPRRYDVVGGAFYRSREII